ncbi:PREDICTED: cyclin-dependent kinase inhibitor 1C-like isoform X4 [Lupinus angustifolius]|uniref:cyclin-dependent kinase inhibitor 1C-like isoform X4 n=1 Tax=Lupinus angustifolius TaxID=3871 RepID=UPI00092FACF9|nr:PREDICTED: cyclin-dependent kinase inhibitor 1C-like isoform X4 [Lupinus angustifolius]
MASFSFSPFIIALLLLTFSSMKAEARHLLQSLPVPLPSLPVPVPSLPVPVPSLPFPFPVPVSVPRLPLVPIPPLPNVPIPPLIPSVVPVPELPIP